MGGSPWVVLVNPTAGGGRGASWGVRTANELRARGERVRVVAGHTAADAERRARAEVRQPSAGLVAVGGDGLVNLAINVAAQSGVPLGIVAAGTGNDFARALGLVSRDTSAAVSTLLSASEEGGVAVDVGELTDGRLFGCVLSTGFDAAVNARANRLRFPPGRSRYPVAMLRELAAFQPIEVHLEVDDVEHHHRAMLVAVGNTASYGGGMRICPSASVTDGLFTITVVDQISVPELLWLFPRVYRGTHVAHPRAHVYTGRSVRLRFRADGGRSVPVFADGEPVRPTGGEVAAGVRPGAVRILMPRLP
jgi:diacylglycerol kinase (ATP)